MPAGTQVEKGDVFPLLLALHSFIIHEALFFIIGPKGNSDFCYPETVVSSGKAKVNFGSGRSCKKLLYAGWYINF